VEALLALLVVLLWATPVVALIVALRTLRRARGVEDLARRVRHIEREIAQIHSRVKTGEPSGRVESEPPAPAEREATPVPRRPESPSAPATPVPAPPRRAPAPRRRLLEIDWERWIGMRGFAVAGGVVMALAGIFFFKHAFERGWITPQLRVTQGCALGVACLVVGEVLRRRAFVLTPAALSGAGIVILYASFWAAHRLYSLFSFALSFSLMASATALCGFLTVRHRSQMLAVLALLGGFATPLLLGMDLDRPVGLFGYILLLDLGLLAIGARSGWPALGLLGLLGTVLFEGLWVVRGMRAEDLPLALGILATFAGLFALAAALAPRGARSRWAGAGGGALILPFAFALYFAQHVDLGDRLYPTAALAIALGIGASVVGRRLDFPFLAFAAAAGNVAVTATWILGTELTATAAWEASIVSLVQALGFHAFVERERWRLGSAISGPALAGMVSLGGLSLCLVLGAGSSEPTPLAPWLAGLGGLAIGILRQAAPARAPTQIAAGLALGLGLDVYAWRHARAEGATAFPEPLEFFAVLVGVVALFLGACALARDAGVRAWRWRAGALLAIAVLLPLSGTEKFAGQPPLPFLGTTLLLGLGGAAAGTGLRSGRVFAVAAASAFVVQVDWLEAQSPGIGAQALPALALFALSATAFGIGPLLLRTRFRETRTAWVAAALAGPAWFWPMKSVWERGYGEGAIGLLPLFLALVPFAGLLRLRGTAAAGGEVGMDAFVAYAAAAAGLASLVVPLQLGVEWVAVSAGLIGLALTRLWKRFDRPALKYIALGSVGLSFAVLLVNAFDSGHYLHQPRPVLNWLLYVYGVPAAGFFAAAAALGGSEVARARRWEASLYRRGIPVGSLFAGVAGVVAAFLWIHLTVVDAFTRGERIVLGLERVPMRDLVLSIAWAAYGLALLVVGLRRRSRGMRWASLLCLLATLGKVFLHDLSELEGLHRVASLLGLAVSLIVVSLLYQRLVFRTAIARI